MLGIGLGSEYSPEYSVTSAGILINMKTEIMELVFSKFNCSLSSKIMQAKYLDWLFSSAISKWQMSQQTSQINLAHPDVSHQCRYVHRPAILIYIYSAYLAWAKQI